MTEYEKKIKEVKDLCRWFDEHGDKVKAAEDCILIAVVDKNYIGAICGVGSQEGMGRIIDKALSEMSPRCQRTLVD